MLTHAEIVTAQADKRKIQIKGYTLIYNNVNNKYGCIISYSNNSCKIKFDAGQEVTHSPWWIPIRYIKICPLSFLDIK